MTPLEDLIYDWNLEGDFTDKIENLQNTVAERYLLNKCFVYFNFDLISNMQLMLQKMIQVQEYDYSDIFEKMFIHLQGSSMTAAYKRE